MGVETLQNKLLFHEIPARKLSGVSASCSVSVLRKRLRGNDEAFDLNFPAQEELPLTGLPWKRLKTIASTLGVCQGDRSQHELLQNLERFLEARCQATRPDGPAYY